MSWKDLPAVPGEDELVRQYEPEARRAARVAVRRNRLVREDDAHAAALLAVLEAVRTHDPARGASLLTRIRALIPTRITDASREDSDARRKARPPRVTLDPELADARPGRPPAWLELDEEEEVARLLAPLPPRLRQMVRWLYLEEWTQIDIAKKIGVDPSRVNQLLNDAAFRLSGRRRRQIRGRARRGL